MVLLIGLEQIMEQLGYVAIFSLITASTFGVPLPEDPVFLVAGWAASQHFIRLPIAIIVGLLAVFAGDNIGYFIGRKYGEGILNKFVRGQFWEKTMNKLINAFHTHPYRTIFLARFVFGLRIVAPILSGAGRVPWKKFISYNFAGALIMVPTMIGIGYFAGQNLALILKYVQEFLLVFAVIFLVLGIGLGWLFVKKRRKRKQI